MTYKEVIKSLQKVADKEKAKNLSWFFKTGKGEYGEGDIFMGVMVPQQRMIAKEFEKLPLSDIQSLLISKVHEQRLVSLLILVRQFERADEKSKKKIFNFYIKNSKFINNWDLVDLSAPNIVGKYLLNKPKEILYTFAKSKNLWQKRISIISTLFFIREKDYKDTLKISEMLLSDKHDLIHKAVGWALREVGKRDEKLLKNFLDKHIKIMSRTTLRYSIEKFEETKRQKYLSLH